MSVYVCSHVLNCVTTHVCIVGGDQFYPFVHRVCKHYKHEWKKQKADPIHLGRDEYLRSALDIVFKQCTEQTEIPFDQDVEVCVKELLPCLEVCFLMEGRFSTLLCSSIRVTIHVILHAYLCCYVCCHVSIRVTTHVIPHAYLRYVRVRFFGSCRVSRMDERTSVKRY